MLVPVPNDLAEEPTEIGITLKTSLRTNVLASVTVELETSLGTITISDARILRNRSGVAWFSMPTYGPNYSILMDKSLAITDGLFVKITRFFLLRRLLRTWHLYCGRMKKGF